MPNLSKLSLAPEEKKEEQKWYQSGLRFGCTQCGRCCTGSPGYVWVGEEEIIRMAAFLQLDVASFSKKYLRKVDNRWSLRENLPNYDCVFLKDKACMVYAARPTQCQTFPWWPRNLQSEKEWHAAAKQCEGINHPDAPLVENEKIQQALKHHHEYVSS